MKKLFAVVLLMVIVAPGGAWAYGNESSGNLIFPFGIKADHTIQEVAAILSEKFSTNVEPIKYSILNTWDHYGADVNTTIFGQKLKDISIYLARKVPIDTERDEMPTDWRCITFSFIISSNPLRDFYMLRDSLISTYGAPISEVVWNNVNTFDGKQTKYYEMPGSWVSISNTFPDDSDYGAKSKWNNMELEYAQYNLGEIYTSLLISFNSHIEKK